MTCVNLLAARKGPFRIAIHGLCSKQELPGQKPSPWVLLLPAPQFLNYQAYALQQSSQRHR